MARGPGPLPQNRRRARQVPLGQGDQPRPWSAAARVPGIARAARAAATSSSQGPASPGPAATGPSKESVLRIHERAGHPTNEIYEVPVEVE
jgi:hypothetical protein